MTNAMNPTLDTTLGLLGRWAYVFIVNAQVATLGGQLVTDDLLADLVELVAGGDVLDMPFLDECEADAAEWS